MCSMALGSTEACRYRKVFRVPRVRLKKSEIALQRDGKASFGVEKVILIRIAFRFQGLHTNATLARRPHVHVHVNVGLLVD